MDHKGKIMKIILSFFFIFSLLIEVKAQDLQLFATFNGRVIAMAPGSFNTNPQMILADPGSGNGLPTYQGFTHAGAGFVFGGRTDSQNADFFKLTNVCGAGSLHNTCTVNLLLESMETTCCGNADPNISFFIATGTNLALPSASGAGTRPGKLTWNGYATTGRVQTETATIEAIIEEQCRNTGSIALEINTACGTSVNFKTTPIGKGSQQITGSFSEDGALWLGNWPNFNKPSAWYGNSSGGGAGAVVLHDSHGTLQAIPNATVLRSQNGRLYVRLSGSTGEQPLLLQSGGVTPGHKACWGNFGELVDCGP